MEFKKVWSTGCGLMGAGIAQTAAMAGYERSSVKSRMIFSRKGSRHREVFIKVC